MIDHSSGIPILKQNFQFSRIHLDMDLLFLLRSQSQQSKIVHEQNSAEIDLRFQ